MVIKIDTTLSPTITQANFIAAIVTAMTNAGHSTPFDSYVTSGTEFRVWELNFNALTWGKVYLQVSLTSGLSLASRLFAGWNATTHVGTSGGTQGTAVGFNTSTTINFSAFKPLLGGSEFKTVLVQQGTLVSSISYVRPAFMPTWWDENTYPYCFHPINPTWATLTTTAVTPYGSLNLTTSVGDTSLVNSNPGGQRDVLAGLFINSGTTGANLNSGKAGRTSSEIGIATTTALSILSIVQVIVGVEEYYVMSAGGTGQLVFLV